MKEILKMWIRSRNVKWLINRNEAKARHYGELAGYCRREGHIEESRTSMKKSIDYAKEVKRLETILNQI